MFCKIKYLHVFLYLSIVMPAALNTEVVLAQEKLKHVSGMPDSITIVTSADSARQIVGNRQPEGKSDDTTTAGQTSDSSGNSGLKIKDHSMGSARQASGSGGGRSEGTGNDTTAAGHASDSSVSSRIKRINDTDSIRIPGGDSSGNARAAPGAIPVIGAEDADEGNEEDGMNLHTISSVLTASRDPFLNAAAFVFSPYRFRPRGYGGRQEVLINGVPMNDPGTGAVYWSQWGGLNDVFRSRSSTYGLAPSEYAFGGINGTTAFEAGAATLPQQTRITYSLSNRQYRHRVMLTHSSGLLPGGWAYAVSFSRRWAKEGYVPGTFYDAYAAFGSVSRQIGRHRLDLTAFAAPARRGKASAATDEVYALAGSHFYNANWGYQDGEKRNARVAGSIQPAALLSHTYAQGRHFRMVTSAGWQSGKNGNTALDWYQAKDPRPDYYRYLPGWQISNYGDPDAAADIVHKWKTAPEQYAQIDWERLYQVNYANTETIYHVNGIAGNDITGHRSVYVVGNDVEAMRRMVLGSRLERTADHLALYGGITGIVQRTEYYRELQDLLGGDFYLNLNQFADQQAVADMRFNQYDLNVPDRLVREGDIYNYHYLLRQYKYAAWMQGVFTYDRFDFFLAANGSRSGFSREGLFRSGLFPDGSYGKSPEQAFITYSTKAGVTWKVNGRNYLFVNGGMGTEAPAPGHTFISIRMRSQTTENPRPARFRTVEGGYLLRAPGWHARVAAYATDMAEVSEIRRFYNDDPAFRTFVNYVMQHVAMRFTGAELALEAKVHAMLSLTGVAALGQAFYTGNPTVSIYRDNDTTTTARPREVYIRNYYLAAGPQSAYTFGLNYRARRYWYASLNVNYLDRNYVAVNPDRRTAEAAGLLEPGSPRYGEIFAQERLPAAFTADLFFGKSFFLSRKFKKLPRNTALYLNAGINNLLNNTNIRTGGYEQLRFDFSGQDPGRFPSKYFYGYGTNYFINVSIKY